ncbi:biopolymer transport protein ExbB [Sporomusaceae bacterium BoRhaA]|uniref:MotA/TolQ/ExbB proton channel family protein n=1 Tax=Pelorhabdus rhamnosifermentans TaxID=2772457 RepID=UPI001C06203F|nr:MotA/TolQ/ExbB proton channel family protein [Pelorhabdus rhamnosifermentans]MBU2700956.1 biopolymer transport protein ExbB [Pelorhabdus rhamnosifermentans]
MLDMIKGGWVMLPLMACSLIALTIVIERFFYFRRIGNKVGVAEEVLKLVDSGRINDGLKLSNSSVLPLVKVMSAGIAHSYDPAKAMAAAGINELSVMRRGMSALDTIITMAPLLGLLGTILGMMNSFQVMAMVDSGGSPNAVTGGVAEALIATATGITIAVLTLIPYNYFSARIERESETIEHYATELEMALVKQD